MTHEAYYDIIIHAPIKEGMLVKFKSADELMKLNTDRLIRYTIRKAKYRENRWALITNVNVSLDSTVEEEPTYSYQVYFPDDGNTYAWPEDDEFCEIIDPISDYRSEKLRSECHIRR